MAVLGPFRGPGLLRSGHTGKASRNCGSLGSLSWPHPECGSAWRWFDGPGLNRPQRSHPNPGRQFLHLRSACLAGFRLHCNRMRCWTQKGSTETAPFRIALSVQNVKDRPLLAMFLVPVSMPVVPSLVSGSTKPFPFGYMGTAPKPAVRVAPPPRSLLSPMP